LKWIDSHAHLDDRAFDVDRASVIARCSAEDMGILSVGASVRSSHAAIRLAKRYRNMWATVGVHPHSAKTVDVATMAALKDMAHDELVVAIGEIGLDYYRDLSPRDRQREAFAKQLDLAADVGLPLCLHNRESTDDLLAILRNNASEHRGVVHSFLGDRDLAETFLTLGLHLGVGGPLTYPKNGALRDAVKHAPLNRILLETDCPYLTPVPYRGRRNEPTYVTYVAEEIARLKGISIDEVASQTMKNTCRLFSLTDTG
jgi:TatD DNase family protein